MKVITFSRHFPSYHPKAGQPTYFVEKIWAHLVLSEQFDVETCEAYLCAHWCEGMFSMDKVSEFHDTNTPKIHTIRSGHRWKEGEQFSPRVWSGRPYFSKQIVFAPPLTIKKTEDIGTINYATDAKEKDLRFWRWSGQFSPSGAALKRTLFQKDTEAIAANDGLAYEDFVVWFSKSSKFEGQIIHF